MSTIPTQPADYGVEVADVEISEVDPTESAEDHQGHGYIGNKKAYLDRLRRIEGQVRGLHRMVDTDTYCIDILTQVSATTAALQSVALGLLHDHLSHCVVSAAQDGSDPQAKVDEATAAIRRLIT